MAIAKFKGLICNCKPSSFLGSLPSSLWPQEIYYYAGKGRTVSQENVTKESVALKGVTNPDQATLADLTGEAGPLAAGVLPHLESGQADGDKNTWEAVTSSALAKRKTVKPNTEPAQPVVPKTLEENCS